MKRFYIEGGSGFMGFLTILLIITMAWIVYHFVIGYCSKQANYKKFLRRIEYGKSMGLFALIVGIVGQMTGLYAMLSAIEKEFTKGMEINPALVFEGIKVTMICTIYGILIYLLSIVLWFVSSMLIEKKSDNINP